MAERANKGKTTSSALDKGDGGKEGLLIEGTKVEAGWYLGQLKKIQGNSGRHRNVEKVNDRSKELGNRFSV